MKTSSALLNLFPMVLLNGVLLVTTACSASKPDTVKPEKAADTTPAPTADPGMPDIQALCPQTEATGLSEFNAVDELMGAAVEKLAFLQDDDALCLLTRANAIAPDNLDVLAAIAYVLALNKRVEEATRVAAKVVWGAEKESDTFALIIDINLLIAHVKEANPPLRDLHEFRPDPEPEQVTAFYRDNDGHTPVPMGFDASPGEICGNGRSLYWTTYAPKKPIPHGWKPPPPVGSDPEYVGPDPRAPIKESPYSAPTPKTVVEAPDIADREEGALFEAMKDAVGRGAAVGYWSGRLEVSGLDRLGARFVSVDGAMLDGGTEKRAAGRLLRKKIDYLLVDRTGEKVEPWLDDNMHTLKIRLRDAVEMSWFHPVVLGTGWALYRVGKPAAISLKDKQRLTSRVRKRLSGGATGPSSVTIPDAATGDGTVRVIVSLRKRNAPELKGRKLVKRYAAARTLADAVDAAADRIRFDWDSVRENNRKMYELKLPVDLAEAVDMLEIEIDVLHDVCALTDRRRNRLPQYMEPGIHGLMLTETPGNTSPQFLEPGYAVDFEVDSATGFLVRLLEKNSIDRFLVKEADTNRHTLDDAGWEGDVRHNFERFSTIHWIEGPKAGGRRIVDTYRGGPLRQTKNVTAAALKRAITLGATWLLDHQSEDGRYAYKYSPNNSPGTRWATGNNIVRHAMTPTALVLANGVSKDPRLIESARRGIDYTLEFLRKSGNRCVVCHRDGPAVYYNAKLGTVAVTIMSILALGEVADITGYSGVLECLASEMLHMQDQNGHFRQYDVPEDHPYYGAESTLASGELMYALSLLYAYYKDNRYREALDRALSFYLSQWRTLEKKREHNGKYDEEHRTLLTNMVPWLVHAMATAFESARDTRYAHIVFEVFDWLEEELYITPDRARYRDYAGAYFEVYSTLPGIQSCHLAESAAVVYGLAQTLGRQTAEQRHRLMQSMRFCLQLQFDDYASTYYLPVPEEAMGGFRYSLANNGLRNDYSFFAIAAMSRAYKSLGYL